MKEKTRIETERRYERLIEEFDTLVNKFNKNKKFTGPSVYFHKKTISSIRNGPYKKLITDDSFLELIYATLTAWGMHRMGSRGAKMLDFESFKSSIIGIKPYLLKLNGFNMTSINDNSMTEIKESLKEAFEALRVMDSESKLVGNSKVLHHLLPDLVPPIDRQHTVDFFYGKRMFNISDETRMFLDIFEKFCSIAKRLNLHKDSYIDRGDFCTSVPKLIDNAIVGFMS